MCYRGVAPGGAHQKQNKMQSHFCAALLLAVALFPLVYIYVPVDVQPGSVAEEFS